jgi:hypothetical protein
VLAGCISARLNAQHTCTRITGVISAHRWCPFSNPIQAAPLCRTALCVALRNHTATASGSFQHADMCAIFFQTSSSPPFCAHPMASLAGQTRHRTSWQAAIPPGAATAQRVGNLSNKATCAPGFRPRTWQAMLFNTHPVLAGFEGGKISSCAGL